MALGPKAAYSPCLRRKDPFQKRLLTESSLSDQRFTGLPLHTISPTDALVNSQKRSCQQEGHQEKKDRETICRLEEELIAARVQAEEEKERALQNQEKSFIQMMENAGRNRDHLEEEHLLLLRQKMEQEREEALRVERFRAELETQRAVGAALATLRSELLTEVRQEMLRDNEATHAVNKRDTAEQLKAAFLEATEQCRSQAEEERAALEQQHAQEVQSMKDTIKQLQTEVYKLTREKMDYASAFQELQLNYKRFIDLTDSSLHSDYLLRLRRLGRPPGWADTGTQTEGTDNLQDASRK